MKDVIKWLKETSGTVFSYSDELYSQGCALADAYVKNAALRASLKRRAATPVNKKTLYIALRRTSELMERMDASAEKKSETPLKSPKAAKKDVSPKAIKSPKAAKKDVSPKALKVPKMPKKQNLPKRKSTTGSNPTTIPAQNLEG